jgi:hypothetical protein
MEIKKQEAIRILKKLHFEIRSGKERFARFTYGGRLVLTTAVPHGKGAMHVSDKFRKQLRLSEAQLAEAKACPFGFDAYLEHLRAFGIIS